MTAMCCGKRTCTYHGVMLRAQLVGVVLSLLALGCNSQDDAAREYFARKYGCPDARIQVEPRPDLKWSAVIEDERKTDAPAVEEGTESPSQAAGARSDHVGVHAPPAAAELFRVVGCDHELLVACFRPANSADNGGRFSEAACIESSVETPAE